MNVEIHKISNITDPQFNDFLNIPKHIYKDDPNWIMPLNHELRQKLDPRKNSFFDYGSVTNYVAYDDGGNPCGRISAIINPKHNEIYNESSLFFGLFECVNNTTIAQKLFERAFNGIKENGFNKIIGPVNLSTNDDSGFLIEGYDKPPTYMCNYCKPYYHDLMTDYGFTKAIDTYSYMAWHGHPFPEKYFRLVNRLNSNENVSLKKLNKKTIKDDVLKIVSIYNNSFSDNWGFIPITENEALELADNLLPFVDEELIWLAYYKDKPVGAIMGFPDINELIKGLNGRLFLRGFYRFFFSQKNIKGMRIAVLGVDKKYRRLGIETALIHKVHERVQKRPYQRSEFSVILENNTRMRNLLERFGFIQSQKFRLYQKELDCTS